MISHKQLLPRKKVRPKETRAKRRVIHRIIERDMIHKVSHDVYRSKVQKIYGGPKGAFLKTFSAVSGHEPLGNRLLKERRFDLRGAKQILDAGSGAGQIIRHLLKYADADANVVGFDLSHAMLRRARQRLKSDRPILLASDLGRLPFADSTFDVVTCGYVLEHVPDFRSGLSEICRVMTPGGRFLLFATEDSFSGAWTSRMWGCRTFNRKELLQTASEVGLDLKQELWFTKMHKVLRAGGICVELQKRVVPAAPQRETKDASPALEPVNGS